MKPRDNGSRINFIKLKPILDIIRAAIWTGRISGENPVSLCLIARQESAKSQALLYFRDTTTFKVFSDITAKPLAAFRHDIEARKLRHLVLLDLVRVLTHGKGVADRTVQTLAGMMEEGQAATADAGGVQEWTGMPKIGVLMAITPDYWKQRRGKWRQSGFLTRFVRVWFEYTDETQDLIHEAISDDLKTPEPIAEPVPDEGQSVTIEASQAEALSQMGSNFAQLEEVYGFRYHRQMRALAKALALVDGRNTVSDKDITKLVSWQKFFTGTNAVLL